MTKRMLVDATHAEETRVVVLDGNRLEDFDVETATKKQLKGNIYLAKVVRVEPSLQAAFVEYGGGRHGFLAFSEIHPDYYQIPVADRQRLLALQAEEAREDEEDEDEDTAVPEPAPRSSRTAETQVRLIAIDEAPPLAAAPAAEPPAAAAPDVQAPAEELAPAGEHAPAGDAPAPDALVEDAAAANVPTAAAAPSDPAPSDATPPEATPFATPGPTTAASVPAPAEPAEPAAAVPDEAARAPAEAAADPQPPAPDAATADKPAQDGAAAEDETGPGRRPRAQASAIAHQVTYGEVSFHEAGPDDPAGQAEDGGYLAAADTASRPAAREPFEEIDEPVSDMPPPETIGGESDTSDEVRTRRAARFLRNYRIQEVIRRRQIMLVQVVKEERGTKGAALTSYISLAGRYCVLMPNSPRGGGISRKITSAADRKRLKEITAELEIPQGMGLIVRTAGANRPKAEIKRDCEYLMRLWDDIREHTMRSVAPALIYEEASLIKRAIRDVYSRDIDEIIVDGEEGWRGAHDFMRMLMPSHARKVQLWRDGGQSLFGKYQVEAQLDAMLSPTVQLKSGGYLVINQAEALVAIDVNSGRSTRERGIEETALRTNLEAADEVARQLRLRDLAGLIVIDFIDMESKKNNAAVERRLKDALKTDRARIQVGHISHFGLLEMSRQRLRPSLAETSFVVCPHCTGLGHVRSIESSALHVLRAIEDEGGKGRASLIQVAVASPVIMYVLNHKRDRLAEIEARSAMRVQFVADEQLVPPQVRVERLRAQLPESERPLPVVPAAPAALAETAEAEEFVEEPEDTEVTEAPFAADTADAAAESREDGGKRRRRRRRRRGGRDGGPGGAQGAAEEGDEGEEDEPSLLAEGAEQPEIPPGAFPVVPEPLPAAALTETVEPAPDALPNGAAEAVDHAVPAESASGAEEEAAGEDESEQARRRRGRRGGRRRRREETGPATEPAEPAPAVVWTGPTPADPFGGQTYDIFDLFEQHEQEQPVAPAAPRAAAAEPATPPAAGPEPEPAAPEIAPEAAAPEGSAAAPPPTAEAPTATPAAVPAPTAVTEARQEPVVGPAVKPLVIGQDDIPAADRKRGWWGRR